MADTQQTTTRNTTMKPGEVERFEKALRGELIHRGDGTFEERRKVWNGMIDRHPALIVRAASVTDVIRSVSFARENGMPLAVRGGGHNVAGTAVADDALVVDLSSMKSVRVDPAKLTVKAEGGVTIGELDRETQVFGLATPMGVVSATGIAGLTLGGGLGWLRRKHGLASDNLLSVDIVTADGSFLTASEDENSDLFWAVRGGGGNFGVVTCFEYRLHPVGPEVMFAFVLYPGERAHEILGSLEGYMAQAPDEVSPLAVFGRVPRAEVFPERWHGKPYVGLLAMYAGPVEEGESALRPLRSLGEPIADLSGPMPYAEAQQILDEDYPDGGRYYWKSTNVNGLSEEVISRLVSHANSAPSDHSTIDVWYQGGAMARVGAHETAFGDRSSSILLGVEGNWEDPRDDDRNITWVRETVADMRRYSDGGMYLNFPGFGEEGSRMVRDAYGENYARLAEIKRQYDPNNLFRLNQNIDPASE